MSDAESSACAENIQSPKDHLKLEKERKGGGMNNDICLR